MRTAVVFLGSLLLIHASALHAQIPEWEDSVQLNLSGRSVESAFSNGYGQHIGVARTSNARHFLIGNNGTLMNQSPDLGGSLQGVTAVTAFGVSLNVANRYTVGLNHDVIRLWRSSDGGEHWPPAPLVYDPAAQFSNQVVDAIDACADARGVHIVWQSGSEIYYILYDDVFQHDFVLPKLVTNLNPGTGVLPKVITSTSKVHVSFIRTDVAPDSAATRDATFSLNPLGLDWEGTYETIPYSHNMNQSTSFQSLTRCGDTLHLVFFVNSRSPVAGERQVLATKRAVSATTWLPPTWLDSVAFSSGLDNRRCLAVLGDTVFVLYNPARQSTTQLCLRTHTPTAGWSTPTIVVSNGNGKYEFPTVSASRTGVYFFWHRNNYSTAVMRRKVYSLTGHITENTYFTGKNWVTGDLTVDSGYTVTLKAGSITYVSDNKKLIVANGATLKKEPGSQIVFGSGAKYQINTTLLNGWNMTGIPAVLSNFDTSAVYPTATSNVFSYNGGYVVTNPLSNDRGFWVKFGFQQNHVYEGGFIDSMAMVVNSGWNIIGSISSPIDTAMVYSSPPGAITLPFYKYNNGYVPVTTLVPGGGYWIKTTATGRIILNLRSQGGSLFAQEGGLGSYDKFTVTDANGSTQDLYVRNATLSVSTENLEMPPPPPGAEFDARFVGGDFLRTVDPDSGVVELDIAVEALAYPVTLFWQLNPENGIAYLLNGGGLGRAAHSGGDARIAQCGSIPITSGGTIRLSAQSRHLLPASGIPEHFVLHQNYPNPFNPQTRILFDLPYEARVDLVVFDLLGRQVAMLVNGISPAGRYSSVFDAVGLPSGVYFYRLQATAVEGGGSFSAIKKLLLLR